MSHVSSIGLSMTIHCNKILEETFLSLSEQKFKQGKIELKSNRQLYLIKTS